MTAMLGRLGWVQPWRHQWFDALTQTLDVGNPELHDNATLRMRFANPPMAGPAGDRVRFRIQASSVALASMAIAEAWIGKAAKADSGLPMGDGVQVTFRGSPSWTLGTNGSIFSDPVPFDFNPDTHDLIISLYISAAGTSYVPVLNPAPAGVTGIEVVGNSASSSASPGGGSAIAWAVDLVQGNAEYIPAFVYAPPAINAVDLTFWDNTYVDPAISTVDLTFEAPDAAPTAYAWTQIGHYAQTSLSTGWEGYTLRNRVRAASLSAPTGPYVRLKVKAGSTVGVVMQKMFACAVPQAQTNFNGSGWSEVRFNGNTTLTLAAGAEAWSDPVFIDGFGDLDREQILTSSYFSGPSNVSGRINSEGSQTDWRGAWILGDSANSVGSWSGTAPASTYFLESIESSPPRV